jgi:hypothetical protein
MTAGPDSGQAVAGVPRPAHGRAVAQRRERSRLFRGGRVSPVIGGWVALWRPQEIFLSDLWPLRAQAKLDDRLGRMRVSVA